MSNLEEVILAASRIITRQVNEVLYGDGHTWSTRPCETCRTITSLIGESFGCVRYAKERSKRNA